MISILMATYNGERYIAEQLDSLFSQTVDDFTLWITDDCSADGTWDILKDYESRYLGKIKLFKRSQNSGSAKFVFLNMMVNIKDEYIMLCDQDDVWLPDKIEKTLIKMKETEERYGYGLPILIHTDLHVTDQNLKTIENSYKQAMNSNFNKTAFHQILIQNTLTGCTAMYNRPLAELIDQEPEYCVMHDWWLQLIAAAFGKIGHIEDQTVLYRQHDKNEIGAKDVRRLSYKINRFINKNEVKEAIKVTYAQAESFLKTFYNRMNERQIKLATEYCSIPEKNKLTRWYTACRLKTFKNGFSRNVAYFLFI